jgi:hypothetical protein
MAMDEWYSWMKKMNFYKNMDAKLMRNHGGPTISFIKGGIISCWFYLENTTHEMLGNTSNYTTYFLIWIFAKSKPFKI